MYSLRLNDKCTLILPSFHDCLKIQIYQNNLFETEPNSIYNLHNVIVNIILNSDFTAICLKCVTKTVYNYISCINLIAGTMGQGKRNLTVQSCTFF